MAAESFYVVLTAAVDDLLEHGFDSHSRLDAWLKKLKESAARSLVPEWVVVRQLRDALGNVYRRLVDKGQVRKWNKSVSAFTIERIKPKLRAELDRRILASADLIKLNRTASIQRTLERFAGWATSIPIGGTEASGKRKEKQKIKRGIAGLPFEERRVIIDQSAKLSSAISEIIAVDGGAIAGIWHHIKMGPPSYQARPEHVARDKKIFVVRDNWALKAGLMKLAGRKYMDEVTKPGEEVYCLPEESRIPYASGVRVAYRRRYSGDLTTIVTGSGVTLRATPNHPILTPFGWRPIGSLNEGDEVVEVPRYTVPLAVKVKPDKNNRVATISEVFGAAQEFGLFQRINGTRLQFHGDGTDSDVDVVRTTRPLIFGRKVTVQQRLAEFFFVKAAKEFSFGGAFDFLLHCRFLPSPSFMRILDQLPTPLCAYAGHSELASFRRGAERGIYFDGKDVAGDLKPFGEAKDTFPFAISTSRLVDVKHRAWSGHVYNLQTDDGWYVAEGIVTHNCSCRYSYLSNLRDLPADMLTAKGKEKLLEVGRALQPPRRAA